MSVGWKSATSIQHYRDLNCIIRGRTCDENAQSTHLKGQLSGIYGIDDPMNFYVPRSVAHRKDCWPQQWVLPSELLWRPEFRESRESKCTKMDSISFFGSSYSNKKTPQPSRIFQGAGAPPSLPAVL